MIRSSGKIYFPPIAMAFVFILAIMASVTSASAADVVVVANGKVADSVLPADKLKAIFLGQQTTWSNGAKLEFVTLKESSDIHEEFLKKFVGRSTAQYSNYWKKQVFTGKGRLPKQFDSESKLIEYVSATDGAVGYVSSGASMGSTKRLTINQ